MPNLANQRQNLSALIQMIDIEVDSTNFFSFTNTTPENSFVEFTHGTNSQVPSGLRVYAELPFAFGNFRETEAGPQPIVEMNIGKLDGLFVNFLDQLQLDGMNLIGKKLTRTLTRAQFIDNFIGAGTKGQFISQTVFTIDSFNNNDTKETRLMLKTPLDLAANLGQTILWEQSPTTVTTGEGLIFLNGITP